MDFIDVSRDDGGRRVRNESNNAVRRAPNARYAPDTGYAPGRHRRAPGTERVQRPESDTVRRRRPDTRNTSNYRRQPSTQRVPDRREAQEAYPPRRRRMDGYGRQAEGNGRPRPRQAGREAQQEGIKRRRPRPIDPQVQQERIRKREARRRKRILARFTAMASLLLVIILLVFLLVYMAAKLFVNERDKGGIKPVINTPREEETIESDNGMLKPPIEQDFLTVNEYSRPGEELTQVNNIFVHYTANKGTSAAQNRSYFENLGTTGETSASAHFIIGYEGEIIQCIPLNEIAYAVQRRNYDSISIECCYQQDDGKFTDATYQSLIRLCAWLLEEYHLQPGDMRRHFDEGGKKCPLYFVEHPGSWEQFITDLQDYIAVAGSKDSGGAV